MQLFLRSAARQWCRVVLASLVLVLAGSATAFSQMSNTRFSFNTIGACNVIAGTEIVANGVDDGFSALTPIGFTFSLDGTTYTQFFANSNGFMTLANAGAVQPSSASAYT